MNVRNLLLGLGAGLTAGYAFARTLEAARVAQPVAAPQKDALAYARIRRALELADTARNVVGSLAFAYGPLASAPIARRARAPAWLRPALYFAPLSLVAALVDLPASFVQEYTLERRFGLSDQNRQAGSPTTQKARCSAQGCPRFSRRCSVSPSNAAATWPWIAAPARFRSSSSEISSYHCTCIPLFNAFEPVTGSLEERLRRLAGRFGVGNAEILRMDMSRQTRKANAFVTGIGRTHRIVLGDTLIGAFPENEIEFVVAHELGHYVNKDTWRHIALGEILAPPSSNR